MVIVVYISHFYLDDLCCNTSICGIIVWWCHDAFLHTRTTRLSGVVEPLFIHA